MFDYISEIKTLENTNIAKSLFLAIAKAAKAQRKPEFTDGAITYSWNYPTRQIVGSFVLPLQENVNEETGQVTHEVADFLIDPNQDQQ